MLSILCWTKSCGTWENETKKFVQHQIGRVFFSSDLSNGIKATFTVCLLLMAFARPNRQTEKRAMSTMMAFFGEFVSWAISMMICLTLLLVVLNAPFRSFSLSSFSLLANLSAPFLSVSLPLSLPFFLYLFTLSHLSFPLLARCHWLSNAHWSKSSMFDERRVKLGQIDIQELN